MINKKDLGDAGETFVIDYLQIKENYVFLEKNYRVKSGEADLIFEKDDTLIFVEVKTMTEFLENQFEKIDKKKIQRYLNISQEYLQEKSLDRNIQIDACFLVLKNGRLKIEHIKDIRIN